MKTGRQLLTIALLAGAALTAAGVRQKAGVMAMTASDADGGPVVLELFTSQSCSSCPPADRLLGEFAKSENIIALGCHVTYWDHLSWKDTYSREACTGRQKAYAAATRSRQIFTPEMRVNGADSVLGSDASAIAVAARRSSAGVAAVGIGNEGGGRYKVSLPALPEGRALAVTLISYGGSAAQAIASGENGGRTVDYTNPVGSIVRLAPDWKGQAASVTVDASDLPAGSRGFAVLVQEDVASLGVGPVLAAGRIDLSR